jgi:hypothetical protein
MIGVQRRAAGRQKRVARRGFSCGTVMDEQVFESTSNMKRSHPSPHASRRPCKRRLWRVTSLAQYGRVCTLAVMRFPAGHKPQKTDGRCETHNQIASKIVRAKAANVKPGEGIGLQKEPDWADCTRFSHGTGSDGTLANRPGGKRTKLFPVALDWTKAHAFSALFDGCWRLSPQPLAS